MMMEQKEIPLIEIFNIIRRNAYIFSIVVLVSVVVGYFYSHSLSDVYQSSATVSPAGNDSSAGSTTISGLGGVAALAGIRPQSDQISKFSLALSIMTSRDFVIKNFSLEKMISKTLEVYEL